MLLRALVLASMWATVPFAEAAVKCVDGLHMVVARGTNETEGTGVLGQVADLIAKKIHDSSIEDVKYPATFLNPYHNESIWNGSVSAREAITQYAENCPGKIALFGYSQGAQVIGNAICGDRSGWMNETEAKNDLWIQWLLYQQREHLWLAEGQPVDEISVGNKIISVILMGDPTFKHNLSFDKGTSQGDGLWPRDWDACSVYANRTRSYCDAGDWVCDAVNPIKSPGTHGTYVERWANDAVEFVLDKWSMAAKLDALADGGEDFRPASSSGI